MNRIELTSPSHTGLHIRQISVDEIRDFLNVLGQAYEQDVTDAYVDAWRGAFDYDRNIALFHDGRLIGTATSGVVEVTVPGPRQVPAIVTGNLTVDRRAAIPGLGRSLFRAQCLRHHRDGTPFLVFSVTGCEMVAMHRRIGSAPMTSSMTVSATLRPRRSDQQVPPGVEDLPLLSGELDRLHELVAAVTPGMIVRDPVWMRTYRTLSLTSAPLRVWGHRGAFGALEGYAVWSRSETGDGVRLAVDEFTTATTSAWTMIIEALAQSTTQLELRNCRNDDAAVWWLGQRGHVVRTGLRDALWIRLLDVPSALELRQYFTSGRICLEVLDRFLPETAGCFLLEVSEGRAVCRPTDKLPDVRLGIGALGALYQGHVNPRALALAGLIEAAEDGAVRHLGQLLTSPGVPWSGPER